MIQKKDMIRQCDLDAIKNACNLIQVSQSANYTDKVIIKNYVNAINRVIKQYI